jgi:hypothetical protein
MHVPQNDMSRLGGVVVSVFDNGPKGCGCEPG